MTESDRGRVGWRFGWLSDYRLQTPEAAILAWTDNEHRDTTMDITGICFYYVASLCDIDVSSKPSAMRACEVQLLSDRIKRPVVLGRHSFEPFE